MSYIMNDNYNNMSDSGNQKDNKDNKVWWFLLIGLIVGFIIGALAVDKGYILSGGQNGDSDEDTATTTDSDSATGGIILEGKNAINVEDQKQGMEVKISMTAVESPTWIAIHEDREGEPGNILGALLVFPGSDNKDMTVDLQRGTVAGKTYYAMFHNDDGGDKLFDYKKDTPLKDSQGNVIMMKFEATAAETAK